MKVLGVTPTSKDVAWAIIEGTRSKPSIIPAYSIRQKFPASKNEGKLLYDLYKFVLSLLQDQHIEKVVILQAGSSKFGNTSSTRIKVEAAFQIACSEKNIPSETVHPKTLDAQVKKFESSTGNSPEEIFNGGKDFKPKPWRDTVLTAWMGLIE